MTFLNYFSPTLKQLLGFRALVRTVFGFSMIGVAVIGARLTKSPNQLKGLLTNSRNIYAWIHQPLLIIKMAFKFKLAPYASHLIKKQIDNWVRVKSWPYAGYKDPHRLPR